jgi:putative sterol carrier protein
MSIAMKLGTLKDRKKSAPTSVSSASKSGSSGSSMTVAGFKSSEVFEKMQAELSKNPKLGADIGGLIEFALTNSSGAQQSWTVNLKDKIGVTLGKSPTKSDCTLILKDEDCFSIMTGGQDATELFMSGNLKIKGDMSFAMKLGSLKVSTISTSPTNSNGLVVTGYKSSQIFVELAQGIKENPELVKEIGAVYEFQVKGASGHQSWTLDLKKGQVLLGKSVDKADCTLILSDDDCVNVMTGTCDATELFMSGGLKIKGDMTLAMKLGTIRDKRVKSAPSPPTKTQSSSASTINVEGFKSSQIFNEISQNMKPEIAKELNCVYEFALTNSSKKQESFVVDCKKGKVTVGKPNEKADVTLIMSDANCFDVMSGAKDSTELFMEGSLKIKGDMSLAMKLGSLKDSIPKSKL